MFGNVKEKRFSTVKNENSVVIASGTDTRVVAEKQSHSKLLFPGT